MRFYSANYFVAVLGLALINLAWGSPLSASPQIPVYWPDVVKGAADKTVSDFGPPDLMFCTPYPVGIHYVTTGEHLYLKGETVLTESKIDRPNGGYVVGRGSVADSERYIPRPQATGWDAWTILLTRLLADQFKSDYPGKEQVILRFTPDGHITIKEKVAFVPAVDVHDNFVTADAEPSLDKEFDTSIRKAVDALSSSKRMHFPTGATATEATLLATFSVDRGLNTWFPDLHLIEDIPQDQQSLWVARICAILDEGAIYAVSDKLRELLPLANRRRYVTVPKNENQEIDGIADVSNSLLTQDAHDYLLATLKEYIKQHKYREAEYLAQRVSNDRGFKRVSLRQNPSPTYPALLQNEETGFVFRKLDVDYVRWRQKKVLEELAAKSRREAERK